jgi:two-component system, OmpR family, response regulator ResD
MAKLLIVDDEAKIREVVKEYAMLIHEYEVDEAENGFIALQKVIKNDYDLIVLDIMMPVMDGFTACKEIKKIKNIPVIMLSARDEEYDKLHGFDLGVDDYVVKPFSPKELMARINAVIKRNSEKEHNRYVFESLDVDIDARDVFIDKQKITLTPKEFDLLVYLIRNKNTAINREMLLEKVWNYSYFGDDRTVDTHIKMLRHNLKEYRKFIVTVRGTGYKFEV